MNTWRHHSGPLWTLLPRVYVLNTCTCTLWLHINVKDISPNLPPWWTTANIIRLWRTPFCTNHSRVLSVEMIFIYSQGTQIQGSISQDALHMKRLVLAEGHKYDIQRVVVVPNDGDIRPTRHPFKLVFDMCSQIILIELNPLLTYGLSPITTGELIRQKFDSKYLIDKVGLLTSISSERIYMQHDREAKALFLELTDPTLVINDIKLDSKLHFKQMTAPDTLLTDEFLTCHPRREIGQLIQQPNDGVSIVWGKIMTIIEEDLWWHSGRLSQPGPSQDNTSFSSVGNSSVTPRFNIKVQVYDGNELTYFKLPHEDVEKLLQISCKDLVNSVEVISLDYPPICFNVYIFGTFTCTSKSFFFQEPDYFPYPAIFGCLIGQSLLFLVHVDTITAPIQERSFTVNKVCSDPELIRMYLKGEKFCHHGNTISTFGRLLGQLEGYTYHFPHLAGTYIGAAPPIDNYNPSSSNIGQPSSSNSAFFNYLTSEIDAELDLDDPIDKYCVHWTPANDE